MESKSSAPSSSSGGGDTQQWWRWSSGKSGGAIASSSDVGVVSTAHVSDHAFASSPSAGSSPSPESTLRWQKRASSSSRAALTPPKDAASDVYFTGGGAWSPSGDSSSGSPSSSGNSSSSGSSPKFFSSTSSMISARGLPSTSARKKVSSSAASLARSMTSSGSSRDASLVAKKKVPAAMVPSPFSTSIGTSNHFASSSSSSLSRSTNGMALAAGGVAEISWSAALSKRRVKKASKTPVPPRRVSLYAPRLIRPIAEERVVASSSSLRSAAVSQSALCADSVDSRFEDPQPVLLASVGGDSARAAPPSSLPPSPLASFAPTASYSTKKDPLVNCARAVLQDCIMKRRLERSSMRKRNIDDCVRSDLFNTKAGAYMSKTSECSILSSCSSSSDEELSQLSSMEHSFNSLDKFDDDDDYKLSKEEMDRRELMLGTTAPSSSPDFDCFSPFLDEEEKGLPVEIRYQLPLALGTANEIDKECTICQIRYGIGDHIVTLPCQHFFHACCVDKWLWNHTSCPLCRTDVVLDMETDTALNPKHNFTECSQFDQETIRRKMRTSSQSAGFRPVVPVNVELTEIEAQLASLSVHETNQPKYLVCPKPQRPHSK